MTDSVSFKVFLERQTRISQSDVKSLVLGQTISLEFGSYG